ncbi:hypothetical protein K438DRAFT_1964942 [Mycena galopus ATCC 62051]|nr:hypothetical protein K438DRAFT_1964942 [Mycena galopus ATCC 62051]
MRAKVRSCDPLPAGPHLQVLNALANFQYYGRDELPSLVKAAFTEAYLFDMMMTAYSRCTRITYWFRESAGDRTDESRAISQRFSKGNVAIFPQDVATLRSVLPPPKEEIHEAMCALFIGQNTIPTRENIKALRRNPFYSSAGLLFTKENLDESGRYADRSTNPDEELGDEAPPGETTMEAVGYVLVERSAKDLRDMKASAVAWYLDKKNYVRMQSGSKFLSDRDPGFLTCCFPHLDPGGIGGFHDPNRGEHQQILFQCQVGGLLL